MLFSRADPVNIAQKLMASGEAVQAELSAILNQITSKSLWQDRRDANDRSFASFAHFATANVPHGLGVGTQEGMDAFGRHLYKGKLFRPWAELLLATTRSKGRPGNNLAESENILPTFKVPTSFSAPARQLLILARRYPLIFDELCSGQISLQEAFRKTRSGNRPTHQRRWRFGVFDRQGVGNLSGHAKGRLLCEVFEAVGLQAQCRLLAKTVGPLLGVDLASKWRAQMSSHENQDESAHHPAS